MGGPQPFALTAGVAWYDYEAMRRFRRFSRRLRAPRVKWEVSQFNQLIQSNVSAEASHGNPFVFDYPILNQAVIQQTLGTGAFSVNAGWKGISIKKVIYDVDFVVLSNVDGGGEIGFMEVSDALFISEIEAGSSGGLASRSAWNPFVSEIGINAAAGVEVTEFPKRILFRRWGYMPITNLGAAYGPSSYYNPGNYGVKRLRSRAFMQDTEGLFCHIGLTNPAIVELNVVVRIAGVCVWRIVT